MIEDHSWTAPGAVEEIAGFQVAQQDERLVLLHPKRVGGGAGKSCIGATVAMGISAQVMEDVCMSLEPRDRLFPGGLAGVLVTGQEPQNGMRRREGSQAIDGEMASESRGSRKAKRNKKGCLQGDVSLRRGGAENPSRPHP